jgi:H+-translocating NAD(P) transhydrogenase subunit alpha
MKIAVLKETKDGEKRVAATPDSVKKLLSQGFSVCVEKGAGDAASFADAAYKEAGATIGKTALDTVKDAAIVATVRGAETTSVWLDALPGGTMLVGLLNPYDQQENLTTLANKKISAFALELVPRLTRAQAMDVLSSQSNLAGYRAVIEAAHTFGRAFPMMMTAAGTIPPARVLVLGAGVAGLQAIATAKRLGAIVSAFDVRAAAKEQVESLGATFIEVEAAANAETSGGYAKEMDDDYKRRQQAKITDVLAKTDIVISTALIPGKPAPVLLNANMMDALKAGSVIADLAAERGGNCAGTVAGKMITTKNGVTILGYTDWASRIAVDASSLYARNVLNFVALLKSKEGELVVNRDDDIIKGCLLTHDGQIVHPQFQANGQ